MAPGLLLHCRSPKVIPAQPVRSVVHPPADGAAAPEPAGLARRLAALVYDLLLLTALLICFTLIVVAVRGFRAVEPGTWWFPISLAAVSVLFFGGCWTRGARTLGMQAWRLRIEREDGSAVGWRHALLRCAVAWIALLPAGLGYWWSLTDPRRRCWHDRLSGTRIVYLRPPGPVSASVRRRRP